MKFLALLLLVGVAVLAEAKSQEVSVKGIIVCTKVRKPNVLVELWAKDSVNPKDLLASGHSDKDGHFTLKGAKEVDGELQPIVRVTHECKAKAGCSRISDYDVPKHAFGGYDMTYVTLDIYTRDEKEKC